MHTPEFLAAIAQIRKTLPNMTTSNAVPIVANVELHVRFAADNKEFFVMCVRAAKHFKKRGQNEKVTYQIKEARKYYNSYQRQIAIVNASK